MPTTTLPQYPTPEQLHHLLSLSPSDLQHPYTFRTITLPPNTTTWPYADPEFVFAFYDGPLVMELPFDTSPIHSTSLLAIASDCLELDRYNSLYLVYEIPTQTLKNYKERTIPLDQAILNPLNQYAFFDDQYAMSDSLKLLHIPASDVSPEYMPAPNYYRDPVLQPT